MILGRLPFHGLFPKRQRAGAVHDLADFLRPDYLRRRWGENAGMKAVAGLPLAGAPYASDWAGRG